MNARMNASVPPECHCCSRSGAPQFAGSTMIRIPLWNTDGRFALVDDGDSFIAQWRWRVDDEGYAQTSLGGARVFMHSMLIMVPGGCVVDHRNRDRTDNRRENLRFASARENAANRTRRRTATEPFVGVRQTANGRWQARVGEGGRHLGIFDTAEDAARARDDAARKEYGDFATLNYSHDDERSVHSRPTRAVPKKPRKTQAGERKGGARTRRKNDGAVGVRGKPPATS